MKDHDSDTFREEHLMACTLDLMFAGTETTSSTLRWALLFMATHPEIQGTVHNKLVFPCLYPSQLCERPVWNVPTLKQEV